MQKTFVTVQLHSSIGEASFMNNTFLTADVDIASLLNISSDIYIVIEPATMQILEWNPAFENLCFEQTTPKVGMSLYEKPFAPHFSSLREIIEIQSQLLKNGDSPSSFAALPIGAKKDIFYRAYAKLVHIFKDKNAALIQITIKGYDDMSTKSIMQSLERRETLLKATSKAAQELLSESHDFDTTIDTVLGILGNATNVDRVYVWSIHDAPNPEEDDRLYTSQLYEWSEGAEPQQGNELTVNMLVDEIIPTWIGTFLEGKCVNSLVKNMPQEEREQLEPQGIISILTAPIIFHGHLWGFIGFDNCHAEYTWSPAEENILRTAGTLISTAIHSKRTNEALYQAQERFRGVEEATGDIIWSVDANLNIDYISPRLYAVLQYMPEEVIGKPFSALLLHPEEFQYTATPDHFIMHDFELRALCKDGSIKWLRSSCKYIFNDAGQLISGFGSSSDSTHIHNTQDALEIANKELEEAIKIANDLVESANKANAIKGHFLANMSHEIRTPMNAIVGITHLLRHTNLNNKQHEYIEKISNSSVTLLNIINDILDFSKLQDGNMVIEKHVFSMQNLISDIEKTASQWIDEKNLQFTVHMAPEVATSYVGDALRLNQILTSLTTNAIKFTPKGTIHISVTVESENYNSALLHFTVKDTGIGISQENIKTLFEGFTQADVSSTRRYGGIGLGLALCRNLTILMEGNIWCESQLGEGSTFHFTCRLDKNIAKKSAEKNTLQHINILAAFPEEKSVRTLNDMLSPLGYTHITFAEDIITMKEFMDGDKPADIILLHQGFHETNVLVNILRSNPDYFASTPIIYYATAEESLDSSMFTVINSLNVSTLHDTFATLLGEFFKPDPALYEKGFEEILREKHGGKKVLLVEDNEINQMIAQSILEEAGLVVSVANNGLEGYESMYKEDFDLVIMDIQMPIMDGLSASRKIREDQRFAQVPIIAMTAHAMEEDREKSLNAGMNDHTTKPIDAPQLFKVLLYWLEKNQKSI